MLVLSVTVSNSYSRCRQGGLQIGLNLSVIVINVVNVPSGIVRLHEDYGPVLDETDINGVNMINVGKTPLGTPF